MAQAKRTTTRKLFQEWLAIPYNMRASETSIATQKEFAQRYGVDPATLSRWKAEDGFMDAVDDLRKHRLDEALTDIYQSLVEQAKSGDTNAIRFAFELAGRYNKETTVNHRSDAEADAASMSDEDLVDNFVSAIGGEDASENFKDNLMDLLSGRSEASHEAGDYENDAPDEESDIFEQSGTLMDREFQPDYEKEGEAEDAEADESEGEKPEGDEPDGESGEKSPAEDPFESAST